MKSLVRVVADAIASSIFANPSDYHLRNGGNPHRFSRYTSNKGCLGAMAEGIFFEFALPDDPSLDRFSCGYERTDHYFRSREWCNADKRRSAPPTYVFRVAEDGPVVGYCAFDFGKRLHPDNASTTKASYLVIYMIGVDQAFQGIRNPLAPGQTYAVSIMASLEEIARQKPNCVGLSLWVRSTNAAAIGLYRKVGFLPDPSGPFHRDQGDPIVTMRKILN